MDSNAISKTQRFGKVECIILNQKINPIELADMLRAEGVDEDIEYIQPDFKMYYSSEDEGGSLSLKIDNETVVEEIDDITNTSNDSDVLDNQKYIQVWHGC